MTPGHTRWAEIDALFTAALEEAPSQRSAFLDRACDGDAELRAAVTALLDASARAGSFLEQPIFTLSGGLAIDRDSTEAGPRPRDLLGLAGRDISHFRVHEMLGSGGMGVVYRAEDLRLGRTVALKFLLPQYSLDATAAQRFLLEARSAATLDHANICTIHEAGETEAGHLFLAMSCYDGETLRDRLARTGPLPVPDAVALAAQVARGLGAAHRAGIVHRDLKPGNLMLTADGGVKILDFGLAKVRDVGLTRTGELSGTVAYMSPEQLQGAPVDGRSDMWSLGVVLYEMLAGVLPFGAGHELSVAYRILRHSPDSRRRRRRTESDPARAWRSRR